MEQLIGEIRMFGGNFAPRSWAFCNGQLLPINSHQALFSILGTMYGGDGRTTFALPDLRGRMVMHPGHGPGLSSRKAGETGGTEKVSLDVQQLPPHNHEIDAQLNVSREEAMDEASKNNTLANGMFYSGSSSVAPINSGSVTGKAQNTGEGQAHENMPPYACVHYIIALEGIFPSRS